MSPRTTPTSRTSAPTWRVNPFVRPLAQLVDATGGCGYPEDFLHCHGAEIEHADSVAECFTNGGSCTAPEPGRHAFRHVCEPALRHQYVRRCTRCR